MEGSCVWGADAETPVLRISNAILPAIATPPRVCLGCFSKTSGVWTSHRSTRCSSARHASQLPQYSPDGRKIALIRTGAEMRVWTCGAEVELPAAHFVRRCVRRAGPDARWLAFDSVRRDGGIYVLADGGTPRMTDHPANDSPKLVRDGRWIYFTPTAVINLRSGRSRRWRPSGPGHPRGRQRTAGVARWQHLLRGETGRLVQKPVGGGEEKQVLPALRQCFGVSAKGFASPDGRTIGIWKRQQAGGTLATLDRPYPACAFRRTMLT
jgi:Tol biopolymer transport system component